MSSGFKIRIPPRSFSFSGNAAGTSKQPLTVEEMHDIEADISLEKSTPGNGNARHPPQRWVQWELDFLYKCFETTQYPNASQRNNWAMELTEKRLRISKTDPKNKENTIDFWLPFYERRIANWFKNRKAQLRREEDTFPKEEEYLEDDTNENPIASPALHIVQNHSVTVVQKITFSNPHDGFRQQKSDQPNHGSKQKPQLPRTTMPQSAPNHATSTPNYDMYGSGSALDMLADLACLQEPLPCPRRDESLPVPIPEDGGEPQLTNATSSYLDEHGNPYDPDVILGATLLMQLKMGHKASGGPK